MQPGLRSGELWCMVSTGEEPRARDRFAEVGWGWLREEVVSWGAASRSKLFLLLTQVEAFFTFLAFICTLLPQCSGAVVPPPSSLP